MRLISGRECSRMHGTPVVMGSAEPLLLLLLLLLLPLLLLLVHVQ